MRAILTLAAVAATVIPSVIAAPEAGTLQLNFNKQKREITPERLARRQSKTINAQLENDLYLYIINITVGTPPQSLALQLDTGSSDIWFPASSASFCRRYGCPGGSYDASSSSTYKNPGYGTFSISYVDGTDVDGQYISDTMSVGGVSVTNLTMAAATQTGNQGYGIMGVAFTADESSAHGSDGFTYPNIMDVLVSQGRINTRSYSLWLDDLNGNTGSILFGGVDSSKYTGSLISVPIQKDSRSGIYDSFTIPWTGLTVTGGNQTSNLSPSSAQGAILDSGTTELYLPDSIVSSIYNGVGVVTDKDLGNVVPCDYANDSLVFSFQFGGSSGPKVNVPLSEFVLPIFTTSGGSYNFRSGPYSGKTVCQFGIEGAGSNPILFGDTFLRSAYVVYDLDNKQIGLAQSNFNSNSGTGSVAAFSSGGGIPAATSTVTGPSVAASSVVNTGRPGTSRSATVSALGTSATTRTPTFSLVKGSPTLSGSGSGGTSSSGSSGAAAVAAVPSIQRSVIVTTGVTLIAFLIGTMLL